MSIHLANQYSAEEKYQNGGYFNYSKAQYIVKLKVILHEDVHKLYNNFTQKNWRIKQQTEHYPETKYITMWKLQIIWRLQTGGYYKMLFVKGWFGCATLKGFNFNIRRYLKEVLVCVTLRLLGLVTSLKKLVTRSVSSSSHLTICFMSCNCDSFKNIAYRLWPLAPTFPHQPLPWEQLETVWWPLSDESQGLPHLFPSFYLHLCPGTWVSSYG